MTGSVDKYVNGFDGVKKEWLTTMISFMRQQFPDIRETISYQMPMYRFDGQYIAFSVAKDHFTFHTLDFEMIEELKSLLPHARFGKGSAKIRFSERSSIPILFDACKKIVARHSASRDGKR